MSWSARRTFSVIVCLMKGRDKTFKKLDSGKSVSHGHLYIAFVECNKPHISHWKKIPNRETEGKVGVQRARNPQAHTRTTPTTKIVVRKHRIWEIAQKIASNRLVTVIFFTIIDCLGFTNKLKLFPLSYSKLNETTHILCVTHYHITPHILSSCTYKKNIHLKAHFDFRITSKDTSCMWHTFFICFAYSTLLFSWEYIFILF